MKIVYRVLDWIVDNWSAMFRKKCKVIEGGSYSETRRAEKRQILENQDYKCFICRNDLKSLNDYFCKYCNHYHCSKHRLPEKHSCANPLKPKDFRSGRIIYTKNKVIYHPK